MKTSRLCRTGIKGLLVKNDLLFDEKKGELTNNFRDVKKLKVQYSNSNSYQKTPLSLLQGMSCMLTINAKIEISSSACIMSEQGYFSD